MSEIEKSFKEEIREKKKIGNSAHNKKGKRGYVRGGVKTPADLMNSKEKKAYTKPSPVTTSNIYYDQIMNLDDFKSLSRQKKMLVLDAYKRRYKVSELADTWQLSKASVYKYFKAYLKNAPADAEQAKPEPQPVVEKAPANDAISAGQKNECSFMLVGDFEAQSLGRKLNGLAFMLDERLKYEVEIHVKEITS